MSRLIQSCRAFGKRVYVNSVILKSSSFHSNVLSRHLPWVRYICTVSESPPPLFTPKRFVALQHQQKPKEQRRLPLRENEPITAFQIIEREVRRNGWIRQKHIEEAFSMFKAERKLSPSQTMLLLRCCGNLAYSEPPQRRNEILSEIWQTIQDYRIPLDISHYNTLLQVYLENEFTFSPLTFLEDLQRKGIEPNRITYHRLISRFCQEGDIEGANKVLEYMKEKGMSVNEGVFNALILGNSRANDLESARGLLQVMKDAGVPPSADTYSVLLQSLAEHKDFNGIKAVLEQCENDDIILGNRVYLDLIHTLAINDQEFHIPEIMKMLKKKEGYQMLLAGYICRLINVRKEEVAYQLMLTVKPPVPGDQQTYLFSYFPKQLIISGYPLTKVVQYCQLIKNAGYNPLIYESALEQYLTEKDLDLALAMLRILNENQREIRAHYFYPIICELRERGDKNKVFEFLGEILKLEVPLSLDSVLSYVMPALEPLDSVETLMSKFNRVRDGRPASTFVNGLVGHLLRHKKLTEASEFVQTYQYGISWRVKNLLADAYLATGNAKDTAIVLGQMLPFSYRSGEIKDSEESGENADTGFEGIRDCLVAVLSGSGYSLDKVLPLLKEMEERGIALNLSAAKAVRDEIGSRMTPEVSTVLERLADPSLGFKVPERRKPRQVGGANSWDLEGVIKTLEANEQQPRAELQLRYLLALIREDEVVQAQELHKKLISSGVHVSPSVEILLIDLLLSKNMLSEALKMLDELIDRSSDVQIHPSKIVKLAYLLVREGKTNDAVKRLLMLAPETGDWGDQQPNFESRSYRLNILDLLHQVADKGDIAGTQLLQEALLSKHYALPSHVLSPLVKALADSGQLDEALSAFEAAFKDYRVTPAKNTLVKALVEKEDTEKIQKILEISNIVHGEMNTLYDLVFSFIECGRMKQAAKILETPGLRTLSSRLETQCANYVRQNRLIELESLVQLTKNLFNVDCLMLYTYLLDGYIKNKAVDKALSLWTNLQEEMIEPSDEFLAKFGNFLQSEGEAVPFIMPPSPVHGTSHESAGYPASENKEDLLNKFKSAVSSRRLNEARDILARMQGKGISVPSQDKSAFVDALLSEKHLNEALRLAKEMVQSGYPLLPKVMGRLLFFLAEAGDVENILLFDKYLEHGLKKKMTYHFFLARSYQKAGRSGEYLDDALVRCKESSSTKDTVETLKYIPQGFLLGLLEQEPDKICQVRELTELYKSKGLSKLCNTLWLHLLMTEQFAEADDVFNQNLKESSQKLIIIPVCKYALNSKKESVMNKAIEGIRLKASATPASKGLIYSYNVDLLCSQGKLNEAINFIDNTVKAKEVNIEHYKHNSLQQVEEMAKAENQKLPFIIPWEKKSQSSSSSDSESDDESRT